VSLTINDEIRRLQKTQALLICVQYAADDEVDFDVGDALAVVVTLIDDSITGLDRLAVSP
jgi:hypothetical protein